METLHRLFALDRLLQSYRYPVPVSKIIKELDCSASTFKRLLNVLRNQYGCPIKFNREHHGYYYDCTEKVQVPGLWFNASELQALLTIQQLLKQLQPGLFEEHFAELAQRVDSLLASMGKTSQNIHKRVKFIPIAHQQISADIFLPLMQGIFRGQVVKICYQDIHGKCSERDVSPQRMVYYRDHWYLDGWCHLRQALRVFWVAGIKSIHLSSEAAQDAGEDHLDQQLSSSYGIFVGQPKHTAHLRFVGLAAMRINGAEWHPAQRQLVCEDGSLELWVPYNDHRELVMDIMRYGAEAEVLEPEILRDEVMRRLKMTLNVYEKVPQAQPVSLNGCKMP